MKGLSTSNLKFMQSCTQECPDRRMGQQSADQWPRFRIVTLVTKPSDPVLRDGYAREALDVIGQQSAAKLSWFRVHASHPRIEEIEAERSRGLGWEGQP